MSFSGSGLDNKSQLRLQSSKVNTFSSIWKQYPLPVRKSPGTSCSGLQAQEVLHSQLSQAVPGCGWAPLGAHPHHLPAHLHTFPVSGHSVFHHTPGVRDLSFARANIPCPTRLCPGWNWQGCRRLTKGNISFMQQKALHQPAQQHCRFQSPGFWKVVPQHSSSWQGWKKGSLAHKWNQGTLSSSCPKVRHHSSRWCWVWCGHFAIKRSFGTMEMEGAATAAGNSLKRSWSCTTTDLYLLGGAAASPREGLPPWTQVCFSQTSRQSPHASLHMWGTPLHSSAPTNTWKRCSPASPPGFSLTIALSVCHQGPL